MLEDAQSRKATRRENEAQQRRKEILTAARTLFIRKGFHHTTLDEIAELAALGKGTIYNYFANKDDLFRAIVFDLADRIMTETAAAMDRAGSDLRSKLLAYAETSISLFHQHDDVTLMLIREHHQLDPKILDDFAQFFVTKLVTLTEPLAQGMRADTVRPLGAQTLALIFDGMIRNYCMATTRNLWPGDASTPREVAELLVTVFFDGIANPSHSG